MVDYRFFTIDEVIEDTVSYMWQKTHIGSGIYKEYFVAYFKDCVMAHAIKIGEVVKLDNLIDPQVGARKLPFSTEFHVCAY